MGRAACRAGRRKDTSTSLTAVNLMVELYRYGGMSLRHSNVEVLHAGVSKEWKGGTSTLCLFFNVHSIRDT